MELLDINKGDIIEVIVITKGNQTYSLTLSDQKYKDIFDQLISTFTFTNQNQTITPTCMTRPACLDATPRCLIAEPASGWCQ